MATILAWLLCALAIGGIGSTLMSALAVTRLARRPPPPGPPEPASLLKPLHGPEPRLAGNLAGFLNQNWDAPIQMVCGIQRSDDPAIAVVEGLNDHTKPASNLPVRHPDSVVPDLIRDPAALPPSKGSLASDQVRGDDTKTDRTIALVIDPTSHGANAKVANLINMAPHARHDLIVLSDSDMAVPHDYLARLAGALAAPGVGAASCLYRGRGVAGRWSVLTAAATSYHFLPAVALSQMLGFAHPCMGSTIALRRDTLDRIGGFAPLADVLADDYELGRAVRGLGLKVALPSMLLVHDFPEASLAALWRHELRWNTTLKTVDPAGYAGMAFTYPLPFALLLLPLMPRFGLALALATLVARLALKRIVDRWAGASTCPAWLLPLRDCLSLAVFLSGLVARSVDWRGVTLTMQSRGRIAARHTRRGREPAQAESDPR